MTDSGEQQVLAIIKDAMNKLALKSSTHDTRLYVCELYNFILTGYNPDDKFSTDDDSRMQLLTALSEIIKDTLTQIIPVEEQKEEVIEKALQRVVGSVLGVYISEGVTTPVHQWDGATIVTKNSVLIVSGNVYDEPTVSWLHKTVGYTVLLV